MTLPHPSSLAFITSGSRGNRLLFYTRGHRATGTSPDQGGKKDAIEELPPTTLAEILAPSSLMIGHKFELSVDEWKFIGHPFSVQSDTFSIAFNMVFVVQSYCCPEAVAAYDHLLHMIGSAIIHEEKRCGYLRDQVALLMQLLEDADIPDPGADEIVNGSTLAQSMNSVLCSLQDGKKHVKIQINSWSEVNMLIVLGTTSNDSPGLIPPPSQPSVRSYSALLLFESTESILKSFPSTLNPSMHRFIQAISPMKSLQAVSQDADIPLLQTLQMASHLVTWKRAMTIYPLSESNMYVTSPICDTRLESKLARQFSSAFSNPSLSLPEVLSNFSLPISLGDLKDTISDERIIQLTVWLLQHKQIVQLHTYVYIVPTIPDSSVTSLGADGNHTPLTGRYDNTSVTHRDVDNFSSTTLGIGSDQTNNLHSSNSGMQLSEEFVGVSDGVELLSHLSAEERLSVLGTSAALDGNDLEQFARLSKYFHGDHHLEGIMLMENIPRSQLLTLIDKFSEILVTCTLPEHSITR